MHENGQIKQGAPQSPMSDWAMDSMTLEESCFRTPSMQYLAKGNLRKSPLSAHITGTRKYFLESETWFCQYFEY